MADDVHGGRWVIVTRQLAAGDPQSVTDAIAAIMTLMRTLSRAEADELASAVQAAAQQSSAAPASSARIPLARLLNHLRNVALGGDQARYCELKGEIAIWRGAVFCPKEGTDDDHLRIHFEDLDEWYSIRTTVSWRGWQHEAMLRDGDRVEIWTDVRGATINGRGSRGLESTWGWVPLAELHDWCEVNTDLKSVRRRELAAEAEKTAERAAERSWRSHGDVQTHRRRRWEQS